MNAHLETVNISKFLICSLHQIERGVYYMCFMLSDTCPPFKFFKLLIMCVCHFSVYLQSHTLTQVITRRHKILCSYSEMCRGTGFNVLRPFYVSFCRPASLNVPHYNTYNYVIWNLYMEQTSRPLESC